jgi:hypothetical protein
LPLTKLSIRSDIYQSFFFFLFFLVFYKLLIPYGDEPDFLTRISRLNNNYLYSFLNVFDLRSNFLCSENYNRLSLSYNLSSACVTENLSSKFFSRILFSILNISGILLIAKLIFSVLKSKISALDIRVLILTFLFPFTIYILGLTSNEIYVHFLSLFIFIESLYIRFLILSILFILEYDGQFLVIFLFSLFSYFNKLISHWKLNYLILFNLIISIFIIFALQKLLNFTFLIPEIYINKISELMNPKPYHNYDFFNRFGIVLFSMSFMTANGIKLVLGNIFLFFRYLSPHLLKIKKIFIIEIVSSISTIATIISILPDHSYAKYYIFVIPIFLKALLSINSFDRLRNSLLISNCINLVFLAFLIYA